MFFMPGFYLREDIDGISVEHYQLEYDISIWQSYMGTDHLNVCTKVKTLKFTTTKICIISNCLFEQLKLEKNASTFNFVNAEIAVRTQLQFGNAKD